MAETFSPITWTNGSGQPINAQNLNRLETGLDTIDGRVAVLEAGGVGGGTTVVDATTSVKGITRLLGGTADSPTVPWTAVTGAPTISPPNQIVTGYIPSGSTTPSVVHSLNTKDLLVAVHDEATGVFVEVAAVTIDVNTVQFTFASAPTTNQYRYTIAAPTVALGAPQVRDVPTVQTYAASLTINAAGGNSRIITATGNITLNDPANGTNGQMLRVRVIASGAQRVVTFAGTLKRPSSIASTLTIGSGLRGDIGLYYESTYGWSVLAAQVA